MFLYYELPLKNRPGTSKNGEDFMKKTVVFLVVFLLAFGQAFTCIAASKDDQLAQIEMDQKALTGDFILAGGLTLGGSVAVAVAAVMFAPGRYYSYSDYSYHYTDGEPALFWPMMIGGGIACIAAIYVGATAVQKYVALEKKKEELMFGFAPVIFPEMTNSGYAPGVLLSINY